ncbi:MAG TPA: FHA domain-containing protein [Kofleriaceae bacterium]|nr:FHA domain-containing protein [Kofleriaceae bacterium]
MYKLVIQDDEGKTTVVPLIRDELTIGRKEGNTIRLTERNVSRRHARLIRQNGSITIEDLNSYNGIRVNGSRIQGRCQIRETDRVQIGDYLIELKSETHDKADTISERTMPIERIDPHATTPVPETVEPTDSVVATTRMTKSEAAAVMGMSFVPAVTEPIAPLPETDPGTPPVTAAQAVTAPVAPVPHVVGHARLVALSTAFAGREFELDKPAMVIGRTEDNDICINHRSISRHHAKLVRENGRHAIVDLQSSNGVRVNGEEYGKVELRRADVIDLGHVRLRFVEAGEDFVFGRDAQAVDVVPQGSSRIAMWLALALLVIGAAVVLFLVMSGGEDTGPGEDGAAAAAQPPPGRGSGESGTAPSGVVPPGEAGERDGGPGAAVKPGSEGSEAPVNDEVSRLLETARKAVDAEKWSEVLTAAKAALEADPTSRAAQAMVDQAQSELANEQVHKQFTRAVAARDYQRVADLYRRLDPESVYRVKAQQDHERLKQDYIRVHAREGKRLADRGRCRDQEKLASEVGRVWSDAGRVVQGYTCKQSAGTTAGSGTPPGAGTPPGGTGTSPGGTEGPAETPGGSGTGGTPPGGSGTGGTTAPPPSGATFEQLLEQSRQAASDGAYAKSLKFCELAMEKKSTDQVAAMTCGIAACRLKSAVKARKFIRRINSAVRQQQVQQICLQEGVTDI